MYFCLHSRITGEIELCVNSRNPTGLIYSLPDVYLNLSSFDSNNMEIDRFDVSLIDLRFIELSNEQEWNISIPDNFIFDFVANIAYVGRIERERCSESEK